MRGSEGEDLKYWDDMMGCGGYDDTISKANRALWTGKSGAFVVFLLSY